jgi:superfamily II DNA or RNA helicase
MSNSDSDSDGPSAHIPDDMETIQPRQAVEDLAEEDDSFSDSQASLPALTLSDGAPSIKPRSYQIEMLEESIKHNTIVAADTGSGKTHM